VGQGPTPRSEAKPSKALGPARPHVLGIDDGPHRKGQREPVRIVGAMLEGGDLVEAVALTSFPVDGDDVTEFLVGWVRSLRLRRSLQAIALGGVTIAGLAVVDVEVLSRSLHVPVLVATRRDPGRNRVSEALAAAGLSERDALLERAPAAVHVERGLWLAWAGTSRERALALLGATRRKAKLPEPLRVAHLIARALTDGESRGRS
jgi:hypothetical protein